MSFDTNGYFIEFDTETDYQHSIGGQIKTTNTCPNCQKNLMLHLTLDTDDFFLVKLNFPYKFLHLFYCMRCSLCW
jgi:hypothetical protein